jgi:hypothetical protein
VILVAGGVRSATFEQALFVKVTLIESFALDRRQERLFDRSSDRALDTANSNYNLKKVGRYSNVLDRGKDLLVVGLYPPNHEVVHLYYYGS